MIINGVGLAQACRSVAENYKTLYVMGCFGAPMNAANKERYCQNHPYNRQTEQTVKIKGATASTFGFDCVCLIKGLLWGWDGDTSRTYGGAGYAVNGVPDIDADQMLKVCDGISTDFSTIQVGEVVWMPGHIGVYIGDGLAVESTPIWKDGVQITAVHNIGKKPGYNGRTWTKHGRLPYITYEEFDDMSRFKDVRDSAWYAKEVERAAELGLMVGISENEFGVGQPVTREQLATVAVRLYEKIERKNI